MPASIDVLLIVDTANTISQNRPIVYMVDDNYPADASVGNEGSNELTINAHEGDTINWYVIGLVPSIGVSLTQFVQTAGPNNFFSSGPTQQTNGSWTAVVGVSPSPGQPPIQATYHFDFTIQGNTTVWQWDPFISVAAATTVTA